MPTSDLAEREAGEASLPSERLTRWRVTVSDAKESYLSRSIISAAGSGGAILAFLFLPFAPIIESNHYLWVFTSALVLISLACFWYVYLTYKAKLHIEEETTSTIDQLNEMILDRENTIKELESKSQSSGKEKFDRFEDILDPDNKIVYGFVPFFPTAVRDNYGAHAKGIGPDFLREIFAGNLDYSRKSYDWSNITKALVSGEIDVIATPLYDTRERRVDVDFSLPIFYADIGMYCAPNVGADDLSKVLNCPTAMEVDGRKCLEFRDLIKQLTTRRKEILSHENAKYVIKASPGELNAKIAQRHFHDSVTVELVDGNFQVAQALEDLAMPELGRHSHFLFCERAQAEASHYVQNGQIVNLLAPGQILFPVCFAVRKSDDTLRKFINLKLLEIESAGQSGIVELMKRSVTDTSLIPITKVDQYYPRKQFKMPAA